MLSIVIIGRNEVENISRLAASVEALVDQCAFPVESIFVDSASTDGSSIEAARYFDRVIELEPSSQLCASSGRYIGTIEARYEWVFYLDADMAINPKFFPIVDQLSSIGDDCIGVVGTYIHCFDNGMTAIQSFAGGVLKSEWAAQFGGAVILRRKEVLRAGNWSPGIFGKEEMELYVRLGDGNRVVRYVNIPMIYHYSEYLTRVELLYRLILPSGGQGKVFYGYGQSIRSLMIRGKLKSLVKLDFEPYLFWLIMIIGLFIAVLLPTALGILFLCVEFLFVSLWMRPGAVIRYLSLPIPLVTGWLRYLPYFRPTVSHWVSDD